jgi:hypothetical protein
LLRVLLRAGGGTQAGQTICVIGAPPGAELFLGKLVTAAGLPEGDLATLHGGDYRGLAAASGVAGGNCSNEDLGPPAHTFGEQSHG